MELLDTPAAAPAKCAVCGFAGGEQGRKFLDLAFSVQHYGRVYLCTECLKYAATLIGMSDEASNDEINGLRKFYAGELAKLQALLNEDYLDRYRVLFRQHLDSLRTFIPNSDGVGTQSLFESIETDRSESSARNSINEQDGSDNRGERPNDVPSTTGDGSFSFGL